MPDARPAARRADARRDEFDRLVDLFTERRTNFKRRIEQLQVELDAMKEVWERLLHLDKER